MTRANPSQFYQLDSELERNLRKSRKRLEFRCSTEGAPSSSEPTTESVPLESPPVINISSDPSPKLEIQEDEDKENEVVPDNESGRSDEATQVTSEMPAPSDNSRLVSPNTSSENSSPYSPPPPYPNRLKPKN